MKKKKDNRGGKRKNSGRKPLKEKTIPITVYLPETSVESAGGKDDARKFIYEQFKPFSVMK